MEITNITINEKLIEAELTRLRLKKSLEEDGSLVVNSLEVLDELIDMPPEQLYGFKTALSNIVSMLGALNTIENDENNKADTCDSYNDESESISYQECLNRWRDALKDEEQDNPSEGIIPHIIIEIFYPEDPEEEYDDDNKCIE